MLKPLALTAFAAAAVVSVASTGNAGRPGGGCDEWGCGLNGSSYQGVLLSGVAQRIVGSGKSVVNAVILPTGEIVDLR